MVDTEFDRLPQCRVHAIAAGNGLDQGDRDGRLCQGRRGVLHMQSRAFSRCALSGIEHSCTVIEAVAIEQFDDIARRVRSTVTRW